MSERRLQLLKKRFLRDHELFKKYKATIGDNMIKGHAKRVPQDELVVDDKPVFKPNKPGKTRVVLDCAAKFRGKS